MEWRKRGEFVRKEGMRSFAVMLFCPLFHCYSILDQLSDSLGLMHRGLFGQEEASDGVVKQEERKNTSCCCYYYYYF